MKRGTQQSEIEALEEELARVLSWPSVCPPHLSLPSFKASFSVCRFLSNQQCPDPKQLFVSACFSWTGHCGKEEEDALESLYPSAEQSTAVCFSLACVWCLMINYFGSTCEDFIFFPSLSAEFFCRVHDWRSSLLRGNTRHGNSFGALRSGCSVRLSESEIHLRFT